VTASWPDLNERAHIAPALLKALLAAPSGSRVPVIVRMRDSDQLALKPGPDRVHRAAVVRSLQDAAQAHQANVHAFLDQETAAGRVTGVRSFWIFDGLALSASPQTAFALAARSDVALLQLDNYRQWLPESPISDSTWLSGTEIAAVRSKGPQAFEWGVRQVRADQVWAAFNVTGTGVVVANLDTGVDFQHPALNANYRGNTGKALYQHAGNWFDATDAGAIYPGDGNGHGTHTMGTLAGQGGIGVAPGARWIAGRVLNNGGFGYDRWIHVAFSGCSRPTAWRASLRFCGQQAQA
jgi:subtilisin family serine protease